MRVCADLGAGTGNCTLKILEKNPDSRVWAFENNEAMLQHQRRKLAQSNQLTRATSYKGDLTLALREFPEAFFDGAVMLNVLYALDDPQRCLHEVFRVLKPGAILALSTANSETDVTKLFAAINQNMEKKGVADQMRATVFDAEDRHQVLLPYILRDTRDQVKGYVEAAGFEILQNIPKAYADAVMIIQARKPTPKQAPAIPSPIPVGSAHAYISPNGGATRDQVFISYSHTDKAALERLQVFFRPLVRTGRLKLWDDTGINAGDAWEAEINAAIARTKVALLLVSPAFLSSDFIMDRELPALLEAAQQGHIRLLWIPLSVSMYGLTDIAKLQAVFNPERPLSEMQEVERDRALAKVADEVLKHFPVAT